MSDLLGFFGNTMFDVALKKAGGCVVLATSSDPEFPPDNIIDG